MATPERKVKAGIRKHLEANGVWFAGSKRPEIVRGWMYMPVQNGMGVHGIPDFCGHFGGTPLYIEAKAENGEVTANQLKRHEEIEASGGVVLVVYSVHQFECMFGFMFLGEKSYGC